MMETCFKCGLAFSNNSSLNDHNRMAHDNTPFECTHCGRLIKSAQNFKKHMNKCNNSKSLTCSVCKRRFSESTSLRTHICSEHKVRFTCRLCTAYFGEASQLDAHIYNHHTGEDQSVLPKPDPQSFDSANLCVSEDLIPFFRRYWSSIRTAYRFDPLTNIYNFRTEEFSINTLKELVEAVYIHQNRIFILQIAFGLILEHKATGELRYFYVSENNKDQLTGRITSRQDFALFMEKLNDYDPFTHGQLERPDTSYAVHSVVNVTMRTGHAINDIPIGGNSDELDVRDAIDDFLKRSKYIFHMTHSRGVPYMDKLCFFRCLSSFLQNKRIVSEKHVRHLFGQWANFQKVFGIVVAPPDKFLGIRIGELAKAERCFGININVYKILHLDSRNGEPVTTTVYRSTKFYEKTLFLNMHNTHFSLITDINLYSSTWKCPECDNLIKTQKLYRLHRNVCEGQVKKIFPGGGFSLPRTVFDKLLDQGFGVEKPYYPYYIVFDFESRFEETNDSSMPTKLVYEKSLVPVSVSVNSNVAGQSTQGLFYDEPNCFINESPSHLVLDFIHYLDEIAQRAYTLVSNEYIYITEYIDERLEKLADLTAQLKELQEQKADASTIADVKADILDLKEWTNINRAWTQWINEIPVMGFNSGRFDLNLIRSYLLPRLIETYGGIDNCIIRGSSYIKLSAGPLNFLDITNFLAAGVSYSKWLAGFGITEKKGIFPYEWLTSYDKLLQTSLPDQQQFFSTLRGHGVTDAEYAELCQLWESEGFKNMYEYLRWYNNKDVGPFTAALDKMIAIFKSMDIDFLKEGCVSLPGIAMTHMFRTIGPDVIFQLYNEDTKDLHYLVKNNIVGGPSIIFNRCTAAGVGRIKGTGCAPSIIEGRDCNGLYLDSLRKAMPTGFAAIWRPLGDVGHVIPTNGDVGCGVEMVQNIKKNLSIAYLRKQTGSGFDELAFVCWTHRELQRRNGVRLTLRHKWNGGQKTFHIRGLTIPVDGWIPELGLVIQYDGCYYHGHSCSLTRHVDPNELSRRALHSRRILAILKTTGSDVISTEECSFKQRLATDPEFADYVKKLRLRSDHVGKLTGAEILHRISNETFFGMLELDIQVPFWNTELRRHMSEFPPIFKNAEVSINDIGPTMSAYAKEMGLLKKPRKLLIGSYHGSKILLPTPLVKWYLDHGLLVTRIYQAIEYTPMCAFSHLVEEVTRHRQAADKDPSLKAYGETFKLLGNSYYGKCLTNIEKHKQIEYCDIEQASRAINGWRFRSIEGIVKGLYEVQTAKRKMEFKLPINIAYFVYGYAKLRMLEFYFDFLVKVLPWDGFHLVEMDTDSLYFALAKPTLEETVDPAKLQEFKNLKKLFLVLDDGDARTTGLFKAEWRGKVMMCTSSKSYIAFDGNGSEPITNVKLSTKGVSKSLNNLAARDFEAVLEMRENVEGLNRGFRMKDGTLFQYSQRRNALTYLYIKRKVLEDGIHTEPLDI